MRPEARVVEWSITEEAPSSRTALTASTFLWPLFIKVIESPKGVILHESATFFRWIPGHDFTSEESVRRFADLARSKVPNYVVVGECLFPTKPDPTGLDEL